MAFVLGLVLGTPLKEASIDRYLRVRALKPSLLSSYQNLLKCSTSALLARSKYTSIQQALTIHSTFKHPLYKD